MPQAPHLDSEFDPKEPPRRRSDNPFAAYLSIPTGIGGIASILIVLALLFVYSATQEYAVHAPPHVLVLRLGLGTLFLAIGIGFWQCRVWAWWLLGTVFWFLLVNFSAQIGRSLTGHPDPLATFLWIATAAEIAVLIYIHRPAVLRHMRFRRPPPPWLHWSPGILGIALGVLAVWRTSTAR